LAACESSVANYYIGTINAESITDTLVQEED